MTSASPMPGFQPIDTLTRDYADVEMQLVDGDVVVGWLMLGCFQTRTFWSKSTGTHRQIKPIAWRPIPLPIAQRNAA